MSDRVGRVSAAVGAALLAGLVTGPAGSVAGSDSPQARKEPMTNGSTPASTPAHTNRLIDATSPYLLQHAHNPVDWYPWGPEALAKARREDKPIFLSIGYSACHWCHVMERESFENPRIAEILNRHFVAIKVDREERPDLDEVYMNATLLCNQGQGGWPMSVFLTPDGKPFFAGTYFPPESRWGRPGFQELLEHVARLWHEDSEKLRSSAEALSEAVRQFSTPRATDQDLPPDRIAEAVDALAAAFDRTSGGLLSGGTNKFPPSMAMSLMLREHHRRRRLAEPSPVLLELVELTLDHMARGGIYDHLGGGIARYSTDPQWLVPHFEKMLYDQALVGGIYLEAYQVTGNPRYADVATSILDYVLDDLRSLEGGFYSSRDADSEGQEGKFYIWSKAEVMAVLGDEVGPLFCSAYDVTDVGNWEGHNILNVPRSLETVAKLNRIDPAALERILAGARAALWARRQERVSPGLDDKILTSWNGLMIATLARGGRITGEPKYVAAASRAADFVLTRMTRDGRLLRTHRRGRAHIGGYLDDYAFFIEGLLDLYEASFDRRWLAEAIRLNDDLIAHFWDDAGGAFFFTADDAEPLIVRTKDFRDGAIPSGNSVALMNLLRLALILDRHDLQDKATRTIRAVAGGLQPLGFERFLAAVLFHQAAPKEIVVVGSPADPATRALIRTVDQVYDPNRVVLLADASAGPAADWEEKIPLLRGKTLVGGKPAAFVCRDGTCKRPVTDPDELRRELLAD